MFGKRLIQSGKLLIVLAAVVLQACTIGMVPEPNDPAYAPVIDAATKLPPANKGGIYRPGFSVALFEDRRAARVGDILHVILSERTQSTKSANTEIKKDNGISFNAGTVLGQPVTHGNYNLGTDVTQNRDLKGNASADQSNSLTGSIAVTVSQVLPNGLLVVRGEKWLTLNNGREYIRLKGMVRPEDIQPDNTVLSTRLANARIAYSGTGDLADASRQGWLSRFFNSEYWPF